MSSMKRVACRGATDFDDRIAVSSQLMRPIILFFLALPVLLFSKDSWSTGSIKVLDTNEWCGRPGIPDWPAICGPPRADQTTIFNNSSAAPPASPYSQILEIDAPDAIYVIRRTSLDGGLHFRDGAKARFAVEGRHLIIRFDREVRNRNGEITLKHDHDRTDILETRKP